MSHKIHVRPLREHVPADNGARSFLPPHGMVREASPFFERLRQIGAAEVRELPARGQRVMIRPVNGSRTMAAGVAEWKEAHEAMLTNNLIHFPEEEPEGAPEEPVTDQALREDEPPTSTPAEEPSHG
jgi:hypothetical protein